MSVRECKGWWEDVKGVKIGEKVQRVWMGEKGANPGEKGAKIAFTHLTPFTSHAPFAPMSHSMTLTTWYLNYIIFVTADSCELWNDRFHNNK